MEQWNLRALLQHRHHLWMRVQNTHKRSHLIRIFGGGTVWEPPAVQ